MIRRLVLAGIVLVLATGIAGATTLLKMEFADLAREADHIVVGTVTAIDGEWEESGRFIHSKVTVAVDRSLRGSAPEQIVLRTPGGRVGGFGMVAQGAASFEVGEQVLLFLTTWEEDGTPKVLGYAQGKSRVVEDDRGRLLLQGGVVDGRSLDSVAGELLHGSDYNIPLRPAR